MAESACLTNERPYRDFLISFEKQKISFSDVSRPGQEESASFFARPCFLLRSRFLFIIETHINFMSERKGPPIPGDVIREASREVLERAKSVTDKRSAKYRLGQKYRRERGVEIKGLMKERPVFYEQKEDAERVVDIDPSLKEFLPPQFFEGPSAWIEAQHDELDRDFSFELPSGESIDELWRKPYDVTKVKDLLLRRDYNSPCTKVISKRLEEKSSAEVDLARRAFQAGIPTPRVLGEIKDMGNHYVWFERIAGLNLHDTRRFFDGFNDFIRYYFTTCTEEKELYKEMDKTDSGRAFKQTFSSFSSEQQKHILDLWNEARKDIIALDTLNAHLRACNTKSDYWRFVYELNTRYKPDDIEQIFKSLGYSSWQAFLDSLSAEHIDGLRSSRFPTDEEIKKIQIWRESASGKVTKFKDDLLRYTEQCLFSFNIEDEKSRIEGMCAEKNIQHKDFADRNFMVEWDWTRNRPLVTNERKPQLFVIDWDPNPDLPKKSSKKTTADKSA